MQCKNCSRQQNVSEKTVQTRQIIARQGKDSLHSAGKNLQTRRASLQPGSTNAQTQCTNEEYIRYRHR